MVSAIAIKYSHYNSLRYPITVMIVFAFIGYLLVAAFKDVAMSLH